jgi:hypothetical protein
MEEHISLESLLENVPIGPQFCRHLHLEPIQQRGNPSRHSETRGQRHAAAKANRAGRARWRAILGVRSATMVYQTGSCTEPCADRLPLWSVPPICSESGT